MRKFDRMEPPEGWPENEAKWNRTWVELLGRNPKAGFAWYTVRGKTARGIALPALKAQTQEHCSFCDGFPVDSISTETIEHFRPKCKDAFPSLAYAWRNLYYCCTCCQDCKGDDWDENLIAPDDAEYSFQRFFEFDFTTGEMRVSSTASVADKHRADVTIKAYGLDLDSRRRSRRLALRAWSRKPDDAPLNEYPHRDFIDPPAA